MAIEFPCPECGATVRAGGGPTARCPKCKIQFEVVEVDGNGEEDERPSRTGIKKGGPAAAPAAGRGRRRDDDYDDDEPVDKKGKKQDAKKSKSSAGLLLFGVAAVLLIAGGVVLAMGLGGDDGDKKSDNKVAQNDPAPPPAPPLGGDPGGTPPAPPAPGPAAPPDTQPPPQPPKPPSTGSGEKPPPDVTWGPPKPPPNSTFQPPPEPDVPPVKDRPFLVLDAAGHTATPHAVLFSPDGKKLLTASADKTVRLWDATTGEALQTLRRPIGTGNEGTILAAALSRGGRYLAVAGVSHDPAHQKGIIHIFNLRDARIEATVKGHQDNVTALAFSPDERLLVSGSQDETLRFYNLQSRQTEGRPVAAKAEVKALAWGPGGYFVSAGADRTVRLWLWRNNGVALVREMFGHKGAVNCVAWAPDSRVVSGGADGTIRVWDTTTGEERKAFDCDDARPVPVNAVAVSKDGKSVLYAGGAPARAGIIDLATGKRTVAFDKHQGAVVACQFSPDGKLAVTAGGDHNEVCVWKAADGAVVHALKGGGKAVWAVGWAKDGKTIAWGNTNKGDTAQAQAPLEHSFRLDKIEPGGPPKAKDAFNRALVNFGPVSLEAIGDYQVAVKRGDKVMKTLKSPESDDRIYAFTMIAGERAALAAHSGLYVYDVRANKLVRSLKGHQGPVLSLAVSPKYEYFVSGSADQTVCVWHPDRSEPVLSLFAAEGDWIAWTPEGYYTASTNGERLMGWHLNNDHNEAATYYPAAQFRASLHRPEAMRNLLRAGGNMKRALALADTGGTTVNVAQVLPPEVEIKSPAAKDSGELVVNESRVEVRVAAKSKGEFPVTSVRLLVDGRPYRGKRGVHQVRAPKLGEVEASWTVELPPGKHTLVALAESKVSKGQSKKVEFTRSGAPELPTLYILAAGVSDYPGSMRLFYGHSDAQLMADSFKAKHKGVFDEVKVRLYKDQQGTKKGIEEGLAWLEREMTPKDVGIFFFSGHGGKDDNGNFYLIPVDINPKDLAGSGVDGELIKDSLAAISGRMIAMFDCCHAGASATEGRAPGEADEMVRDLVSDEYGVIVMSASLSQEFAMESSATKGGFFTRSLAEGLGGAADFNNDKVIHIHELDEYIRTQVQRLSQGKQNTITGRPAAIRSFPLAKL